MTKNDQEYLYVAETLDRANQRLAYELANYLAKLKEHLSFLAESRFIDEAQRFLTVRITAGEPWAEAARDFAEECGYSDVRRVLDAMRLIEYSRCVNVIERMHLNSTRRLGKVGHIRQEWACRLIDDPWAENVVRSIPLTELLPSGRKTWRSACAGKLHHEGFHAAAEAIMMDPMIIVELAEAERYEQEKKLARLERRRV